MAYLLNILGCKVLTGLSLRVTPGGPVPPGDPWAGCMIKIINIVADPVPRATIEVIIGPVGSTYLASGTVHELKFGEECYDIVYR